MISKWRIENFKCLHDNTQLDLAELTVFTGTNSSGKSSLIQSMLMIAQTLQNEVPSHPLVLNGPLVRLGGFEDIISHGFKHFEKTIRIGFELFHHYEVKGDNNDFKKAIGEKNIQVIRSLANRLIKKEIQNADFPEFIEEAASITELICDLTFVQQKEKLALGVQSASVDFKYEDNKKESHQAGISVRAPSNLARLGFKNLYEISAIKAIDKELLTNMFAYAGFASLNHFIPIDLFGKGNDKVVQIMQVFYMLFVSIMEKATESEDFEHLKKNDNLRKSFVDDQLDQIGKIANIDKFSHLKTMKSQLLTFANDSLKDYFSNYFEYLGPLRFHDPVSPVSIAPKQRNVGLSGEYTASVLYFYKDEIVTYIPIKKIESDIKYIENSSVTFSLQSALEYWLDYLGVAKTIRVEALGLAGFELRVDLEKVSNQFEHMRHLTHVGTGVSQVLPILVMCLLAKPGSTLVFEQPELHLHPRVQSRLADFFLSMALTGRQCIIETHSEYLIYALRCRISESLLKNDVRVRDAVKLLFADKKDGKSEFVEIKVNKHGELSAWPDGFFDERQKLSDRLIDSMLSEMDDEDA